MRRLGRQPAQIVLVLAIALGLRLYRLDHQSLWIDEVVQTRIASQPAAEIVRNYRPDADPSLRDQAPLSLLVTHVFLSPARMEWSVRLPAALFGALSVLALFLVAGRFFPPPVPVLAALLLALSPLHVWYSQDGRWYAQWVCLVTCSYLALLHAWRSNRLVAWASHAALTLLGIYTFIFTFLVVACQGVSAWLLQRNGFARPRFFRAFVSVQAVVALAAVPVLWLVLNERGAASGTPRPTTVAALGYTAFAYGAGFSLGPTLADLHALPSVRQVLADHPSIVVSLAIFLPLVALGLRRTLRTPAAAAVLLPWLCGPPLLVFLLARVTNIVYQVRYTLVALPVFILLLAAGTAALAPRARRVALGAVLACVAWSLANHYWEARYGKEDVRGAMASVRATGHAGAPVLVVGGIEVSAEHYGRGLRVTPLRGCLDDAAPWDVGLGGEPVLWMIVGRDWDGIAPRCLARLSRSHAVAERQRLGGIELLRLTRL